MPWRRPRSPGQSHAIDRGRRAARLIRAHRIVPQHDVLSTGDQDAQAGQGEGQPRCTPRARVVVVVGAIVSGHPILHAGTYTRVQKDQPRAVVVQRVARDAARGRVAHQDPPEIIMGSVVFDREVGVGRVAHVQAGVAAAVHRVVVELPVCVEAKAVMP